MSRTDTSTRPQRTVQSGVDGTCVSAKKVSPVQTVGADRKGHPCLVTNLQPLAHSHHSPFSPIVLSDQSGH